MICSIVKEGESFYAAILRPVNREDKLVWNVIELGPRRNTHMSARMMCATSPFSKYPYWVDLEPGEELSTELIAFLLTADESVLARFQQLSKYQRENFIAT